MGGGGNEEGARFHNMQNGGRGVLPATKNGGYGGQKDVIDDHCYMELLAGVEGEFQY